MLEDNNGCLMQANATKGLRRARRYLVALGALTEAVQAGDVHLHRFDSDSNKVQWRILPIMPRNVERCELGVQRCGDYATKAV